MPAMTTMDSDSMITWLTPAMMVGVANGNLIRVIVRDGGVPKDWAASTTSGSTCRITNSVWRTPGGIAKIIVATMPGTTPMLKTISVHSTARRDWLATNIR